MLRSVIVSTILVTLALCQVSKKCQKAYKAFPPPSGRVNVRPVKTTEFLTCNMLTDTCCGAVTEYHMKQKASTDFTALALSTINARLAKVNIALADNSVAPIVFHQGFNDLVRKEGEVTYRELTRNAFSYYIKDSCMTHEETVLLRQRNGMYVKDISDFLKAIYSGLDTIKRVLEIVSEYKVSENCQIAVMRNGLYSDSTFGISMCQVCHRDTAPFLPCPATCKNVARGCLSDLTEVGTLINDLASVLDQVHYQLLIRTERPSSELQYIEDDIKISFERNPDFAEQCATGAEYTYVENDSQAQPANFSASPLNLNGVIESSADYACLKSEPVTGNCWTESGVTEVDSSSVALFTTQSQRENSILPRPEVQGDEVLKAEDLVRRATELAKKAHAGKDLFARDYTEAPIIPTERTEAPIIPTEKTEDESETEVQDEIDVIDEMEEEDEPEVEDETEVEVPENGEDGGEDETPEDDGSEGDVTSEEGDETIDEEEDMKDEEEMTDVNYDPEDKEDMADEEEDMEDDTSPDPDSGSNQTENMDNKTDGEDPGYNTAEGNGEGNIEVGGQEEASTDKKPADSSTTTLFVASQLILSVILGLI